MKWRREEESTDKKRRKSGKKKPKERHKQEGGKNTRGKNNIRVGVGRGRWGYRGFSDKKRKAPFSITLIFFLMLLSFSFHASLLWDEWNFHVQKATSLAFCVLWQMCWLSSVSTGAKLYKANEKQSLLSLPFVQCKNHPLDGTIAKLNKLTTTTSK